MYASLMFPLKNFEYHHATRSDKQISTPAHGATAFPPIATAITTTSVGLDICFSDLVA